MSRCASFFTQDYVLLPGFRLLARLAFCRKASPCLPSFPAENSWTLLKQHKNSCCFSPIPCKTSSFRAHRSHDVRNAEFGAQISCKVSGAEEFCPRNSFAQFGKYKFYAQETSSREFCKDICEFSAGKLVSSPKGLRCKQGASPATKVPSEAFDAFSTLKKHPKTVVSLKIHEFCKAKLDSRAQALRHKVLSEASDGFTAFDEALELVEICPQQMARIQTQAEIPCQQMARTQKQVEIPSQQFVGTQIQGEIPSQRMARTQKQAEIPSQQFVGTQIQGEIPSRQMTRTQMQGEIPSRQVTRIQTQAEIPCQQVARTQKQGEIPCQQMVRTQKQPEIPCQQMVRTQKQAEIPCQQMVGTQIQGEISSRQMARTQKQGEIPSQQVARTQKQGEIHWQTTVAGGVGKKIDIRSIA